MVEQETHKLLVGGSNPPLDTISQVFLAGRFAFGLFCVERVTWLVSAKETAIEDRSKFS